MGKCAEYKRGRVRRKIMREIMLHLGASFLFSFWILLIGITNTITDCWR